MASYSIRFNKGCLILKWFLPPIPKVFVSWRSGLRYERSPLRDLQEPLRVVVVSTQIRSNGVLLTHHVEGCSNLCQSLRQVSKVQQCHQTAVRRVDPNDSPMAVRSVGIRHHRAIPDSSMVAEVPHSRHRLLHKMGGSWSLGHHYGEERVKFRLEIHCMQIWDP